MSSSEKLDMLRRYWECEMNKDLDGIMEFYADDATFKAPITDNLKGTDQLRDFYREVISGGESRIEIRRATESDEQIAAESSVYFQKADGTEGEAQGCNVFTIRDGKFHDLRSYFDPSDFSD